MQTLRAASERGVLWLMGLALGLWLIPAPGWARTEIPLDTGWQLSLFDPPSGSRGTSAPAGTLPPPMGDERTADSLSAVGPPEHWAELSVPFVWDAVSAYGASPGKTRPAVGWFARRFDAPSGADRWWLHFDSAFASAEVWLDGIPILTHTGPYLPFEVEVTELLQGVPTSHVLTVRVDSRFRSDLPPPEVPGWLRFGGLDGRVYLLGTGAARLFDDAVWADVEPSRWGDFKLVAQVGVGAPEQPGELELVARLMDPAGTLVEEEATELFAAAGESLGVALDFGRIRSPDRWSPASPSLYQLEVIVSSELGASDSIRRPVGFRELEFDSQEGLSLNGDPLELRGLNAHLEYPGYGSAVPLSLQRRDVKLLARLGANFLRTSHYPRHPEVLALCDTLGIFVAEELPLWHGSIADPDLRPEVERLFRKMVRRDRAHPSMMVWTLANEPIVDSKPRDLPLIKDLITSLDEIAEVEDPNRWTAYVNGGGWEVADSAGVSAITDLVGYNGGLISKPGTMDQLHADYPSRRAFMSEGPGGATRGQLKRELRALVDVVTVLENQRSRRWFPGGAFWSLVDYGNPIEARWDLPGLRTTGIYDQGRVAKASAHFLASQWGSDSMVRILGRWLGRAGEPVRVWVASNADEVALELNGVEVGRMTKNFERFPALDHPPFGFRVNFEAGQIEAIAYIDGVESGRDVMETPGTGERLVVQSEMSSVATGGAVAVPVRAVVVDAQGRIAYEDRPLTCRVNGPGRAVALPSLATVDGRAAFVLETSGEPGVVTLTVDSPGLESGAISVEVGE